MQKDALILFLDSHGIAYELFEHEAVFTVESSEHLHSRIGGAHSKNLFLRDKNKQFFLVSVPSNKRVDLKKLSKELGKGGLSFGSAEALEEKLKLFPGGVTPLGLLNDLGLEVTFVLDKDFTAHERVNFHPLSNDQTVSLLLADFLKVMDLLRHQPHIMSIPGLDVVAPV
ncbi:MAG TPA: prolyl-tRNA synthetase associated domain-containing protein [Opitutales bacterium]|nr:prolyl-tRNA synthetase associated domain-containing protein [Opitutales bacterium]